MSEEVQVDANLVVDILVNKIAKLEKAAAIAEAELITLRNMIAAPVVTGETPSVEP